MPLPESFEPHANPRKKTSASPSPRRAPSPLGKLAVLTAVEDTTRSTITLVTDARRSLVWRGGWDLALRVSSRAGWAGRSLATNLGGYCRCKRTERPAQFRRRELARPRTPLTRARRTTGRARRVPWAQRHGAGAWCRSHHRRAVPVSLPGGRRSVGAPPRSGVPRGHLEPGGGAEGGGPLPWPPPAFLWSPPV